MTMTVLSAEECDRLLRAGTFGRFALTTPGGPEIIPANYRVVDGEVVVRTAGGSMLARWADGAQVSFEVDLVQHDRWRGWSVIVHGIAQVLDDAASQLFPPAPGGPRPWADGERTTIVRLPWSSISGRKLGRGWDAFDAMPAHTTST